MRQCKANPDATVLALLLGIFLMLVSMLLEALSGSKAIENQSIPYSVTFDSFVPPSQILGPLTNAQRDGITAGYACDKQRCAPPPVATGPADREHRDIMKLVGVGMNPRSDVKAVMFFSSCART